jgi:acetyl-CoA/propionyl-CoA carboxylase biotin carboxyl carrier protein
MIAKVIASGPSRAAAMSELDAALAETVLLGMPNNLGFLRQLLAHEAVTSGHMDTRLLDREDFDIGATLPDDVALAWAVLRTKQALQHSQRDSLWSGGWRIGSSAPFRWRGECADSRVTATVTEVIDQPLSFHVTLSDDADGTSADGQSRSVVLCVLESVDESAMRITCEGFSREFRWALGRDIEGETMWLSAAGNTWSIRHSSRLSRGSAREVLAPEVLSPMPGTVLAILVASDAQVRASQPLLALEAMKMEHQVLAPHDGTVTSISCEVGSHVRIRELLITVEPQP